MKLFDSELNIMEILWMKGDVPAKTISNILSQKIGWNKNTTYSTIKKCIVKGYIERREPNFICHPLIEKAQVQMDEVNELLNRLFDGSLSKIFSCLISSKKLDKQRQEELNKLIDKLE